MKTRLVLFIAVQLFIINILGAQNLKESLGGIKTNFQIYSDTVDLKASDQFIILRTEKKIHTDEVGRFAWAYAYQSYHLEFVTKQNLKVEFFKKEAGKDHGSKLELTFYDSNNNVLTTTTLPYEYVDVFTNTTSMDNPNFYSIDLIDIPVVLLDKTAKINMIKLNAKRL